MARAPPPAAFDFARVRTKTESKAVGEGARATSRKSSLNLRLHHKQGTIS